MIAEKPARASGALAPRLGLAVHANGWSDLACDRDLAAFALAEAVEMPVSAESACLVTVTLGVVLGESARRA